MAARKTPTLHDLKAAPSALDGREYDDHLYRLQLELLHLQTRLRDARGSKARAVALVFEGLDAAGKGSAIRRLTGRLDPRGYRVHPIGSPSDEEKAHNYLWRFAQRMPARGELVIFDRSWYGRVLVERVEKLCPRPAWQRAFGEIAAFEQAHADDGCVIMKFWLHVTKQEQLRRFREREKDPFKEYKIGASDWRSRKHWRAYIEAAEEMLERTHRPHATWHVIPGDDKHHARIAVLQAVVEGLEKALE